MNMKTAWHVFAVGLTTLLLAVGALTVGGCATGPGSNSSADTDVLRTKTFGQ